MIAPILEKLFDRVFLPKPESKEALLKLKPSRRYTRAEVEQLLALASGLVNDGLPIQDFDEVLEIGHWYSVNVNYPATYETWYFLKAEEEVR